MKKYLPWLIIGVLVIIIFLQNSCSGESKTTVVTTPEVKGSFPPVVNPKPLTPAVPKTIVKWKTETVEVENPVNAQLVENYKNAKDSLERLKLYADAIGIREYNLPQEDSVLKTENYIKAQGTILEFQQSYTIKPQKVAVPQKEVAFLLLAGFEVGNTLQFNDAAVKGSLKFQNKKGSILSVGYDSAQRLWLGYDFSVFSIKK